MNVLLNYTRNTNTAKIDELWDSMCSSAINLITKSIPMVANDELLLNIKGRIALFMLTMEVSTRLHLELVILIFFHRNGDIQFHH